MDAFLQKPFNPTILVVKVCSTVEGITMNIFSAQFASFDPQTGTIEGAAVIERRLSDLRGAFADTTAYEAALAQADPVLYTVASVEPARGEGQLNYALGLINPGRVGAEYYLTKGHAHAWRAAAECYIGLSGQGLMLLEDETTGESKLFPLTPNSVVYVPGFTAHRTINTGETPLTYLGVYPAEAGHDYGVVARRNFRQVVVAANGQPALLEREAFIQSLKGDAR
jgi:glucose-6-phosphate isomerase